MKPHVVMIHTVPGAAERFGNLAREIIGDLRITHLEDGIAREILLSNGGMTSAVIRRVIDNFAAAEQADADVIQLTCSSISEAADIAPNVTDIPVLTVDDPMINEVVALDRRVLIVATARTAPPPLERRLKRRAAEVGTQVDVDVQLCEEVYHYLISGDYREYYNGIKQCIIDHANAYDVVVIAQASMVGCLDLISEAEVRTPVLASPRSAIENLKAVIENLPR